MSEKTGIITFKGNPMTLLGADLKVGDAAPDFAVVDNGLAPVTLSSYAGKVRIISAVPSLDTPVCDTETRRFNQEAASLPGNAVVLTVSLDLPFAQKRWCGAAGIDRVVTLSDYREQRCCSAVTIPCHQAGYGRIIMIENGEVTMSIKGSFFLEREKAVLVVIDVQEKLCVAMDDVVLKQLVKNIGILLESAAELDIPVLVTEQYVKGLGATLPELKEKAAAASSYEKMAFSSCGSAEFVEALSATGRTQVIITGMETHVCVLQTVIELREAGFDVHVVKDAVMSRSKQNWRTAVHAMTLAGAIPTCTESVLFQLLKVAGTDEFKKLSKLVR